MNLLHCYEILGLGVDAELATVKESYRRLARRFHPDVNAGDRQAQERFIQINRAYRAVLQTFPEGRQPRPLEELATRWTSVPPHRLSPLEHRLKWQSFRSLQHCLRQGKFARAIAITEGLSQRFPEDVEVRQWQGIIYLAWSSKLLKEGKQHQANTYLRKALLADPYNVKLRHRVEQMMRSIAVATV